MKIRNGFVSNSSASSFVCDVSGEVLTGWDHQYHEKTAQCTCGHQFLQKYLLPEPSRSVEYKKELLEIYFHYDKTKKEMIKEANDNTINEMFEINKHDMFLEGFPSDQCPICQMIEIPDSTLLRCLLVKYYGSDSDETKRKICESIKAEFKSLDELP